MIPNIVIIGGGMVGASLALALSHLSQGHVTIDLVEANTFGSQHHSGFDARAIALAQGTCQQLDDFGIWPALVDCATAIQSIHVSDRGHAGFATLTAAQYRCSALGHVVELHAVGQRLLQQIKQASNVTLHSPAQIVATKREQDHVTVHLDNGTVLSAQLIVAADGSFSPLAQAFSMHWQETDYQQIALIANVTTSELHQGRAFERFTEHGPLALLPLSGGRSSLVWCHPRTEHEKVENWSDAEFLAQLQRTFGWRLGRFDRAGQRSSYPLRLRVAEPQVSHRLALVGNAAQTLHPIAGQGFNLGLRDVITLAETVVAAVQQHRDPGSYAVLHTYQQRRRTDRQRTIGLTDGLIHLFANAFSPLVVGRNLGLTLMDSQPILRDCLAHRTLGWVER